MDLLVKMGEVLTLESPLLLQVILWRTPNPKKTPFFNLKMLILLSNHSRSWRHLWKVSNHSQRHLWKVVRRNPLLNGHPRLVPWLGSVNRSVRSAPDQHPVSTASQGWPLNRNGSICIKQS